MRAGSDHGERPMIHGVPSKDRTNGGNKYGMGMERILSHSGSSLVADGTTPVSCTDRPASTDDRAEARPRCARRRGGVAIVPTLCVHRITVRSMAAPVTRPRCGDDHFIHSRSVNIEARGWIDGDGLWDESRKVAVRWTERTLSTLGMFAPTCLRVWVFDLPGSDV